MKKKLVRTTIMIIAVMVITGTANAQDKKEVVILQDSLYVFPEDMGPYTYSEAVEACKAINSVKSYGYSDWRIPTSSELHMMYYYYSKIKGLKEGSYLSSIKCSEGDEYLSNAKCSDGYRVVLFYDYVSRGEKRSDYHFIRCACNGNIRLVRTKPHVLKTGSSM